MSSRDGGDFSITTGRDGSRSFGEHDDRWASRGRNNRKNFKFRGRGKGGMLRRGRGGASYGEYSGGGVNPRSRLIDTEGDVLMGGDAGCDDSSKRYNPYGSRPKSRRGRHHDNFRYQQQFRHTSSKSKIEHSAAARLGLPINTGGGKSWYRISIPQAKRVDKNTLLALLGHHTPGPITPIQFRYEREMAVFFVDDRDIADAIKKVTRTITMPNTNNLKIITNVSPTGPPYATMTDSDVKKLQEVMSHRYDPSIKMLNLSRLYEDETLQKEGLYLALNRQNVMSIVIKIIHENISELVSLNLSHNKLLSLTPLQDLVSKAPYITSLDLSNNQLRSVEELDKVKGWQLVELVLDGNSLCDRFKEKSTYVSAVRKWFPKVISLDGNVLTPAITFDLEKNIIPPSKGSYFVNPEIQDLVVKFLKEYYTLYDSDSRQPLIEAYHENALFSLNVGSTSSDSKHGSLADYIMESRNLKIRSSSDREKARTMERLLKRGRLTVVSQLCSLPKTTHDANSFVVDVNFASQTLLSFTVNGLFKESENKADKPPIRAFSRVFITVPAGGGVLIVNDMLTITTATLEQTQAAFKNTGPTPSSSPVQSSPPAIASAPPSIPVVSPAQSLECQKMVMSFSQESGMNPTFSHRCLEDNNWNYQRAAQVFTALHAEGKIPPEAFVK